ALEDSNIKKLNTGRSQINLKLYHRVLKASYKKAVFKSKPFTEARAVIKAKRRNVNDLIQQRSFPRVEMGESTVYKSTDDKVFKDLADQLTKMTISSDVRSGETKVNKLFTPTDYVNKTLNDAKSNVSKGRKRKSSSNVEYDESDDKDFEQLFKRLRI
uniref:Uncharacterized protein n=1 Tax=Clytia hemisphaerica TaxID=252671 RepID=A0A7M5U8Q1_9CNID